MPSKQYFILISLTRPVVIVILTQAKSGPNSADIVLRTVTHEKEKKNKAFIKQLQL